MHGYHQIMPSTVEMLLECRRLVGTGNRNHMRGSSSHEMCNYCHLLSSPFIKVEIKLYISYFDLVKGAVIKLSS